MANLKSSQKDIRRTIARTERNRAVKSRIKTLSKHATTALEGNAADAQAKVSEYASSLDKAAKTGILHKNKANRIKSRLAAKLKAAKAAVPAA